MAKKPLLWTQANLISLRAAHIPGVLNTFADMLSRKGPTEGVWRLNPRVLDQIWERFREGLP